jgi:8-oxo-dGTP diphosphatase
VLFLDAAGRVLLVQPTYKDHWDIPGGYVEPGETPSQAAAREIHEELSLTLPIGRLLVVDWAPRPDEGDKILFVFAGGTLTPTQIAAIHLPPGELAAFAFHPLTDAAALLIPRLTRRLTAAATALKTGQTSYLEHGIAR